MVDYFMFASKMARLRFFPIPRPGIELTSVQLHLISRRQSYCGRCHKIFLISNRQLQRAKCRSRRRSWSWRRWGNTRSPRTFPPRSNFCPSQVIFCISCHCYKSTASAMMAKNFELINLWCALSLQSWCPIVYCFHINLEVVIKRPTSRIGKQLIVFYPQSSTIYAEINFTIPGFKLSNN